MLKKIDNTIFRTRRAKLCQQMGEDAALVINAAKEQWRTPGCAYPYRQTSDFYYLTGFIEPDAVAVLLPGRADGEYVIFSKAQDAAHELWHGAVIGQQRACADYGADQAFPIEQLEQMLPALLAKRELVDACAMIHAMRLYKDSAEIALLKNAAEIAVAAHSRAMHICRPGLFEYELAAEIEYVFARHGGCPAFQTIVGGGANGCTLHYSANNMRLRAGDLVVVDAGVEYEYYASDITRTYPVNGKFSAEQKAIYQIVLQAQEAVIAMLRPGVTWFDVQKTSEMVITAGLVDLGLLHGAIDELIAQNACKAFYMHKFGHWLGLDSHDVGNYKTGDVWCTLQPDMVLTVEPGIYIPAGHPAVAEKWWNIGVRIEDEILLTEKGCEVITQGLPKTVTDIEAVMLHNQEY